MSYFLPTSKKSDAQYAAASAVDATSDAHGQNLNEGHDQMVAHSSVKNAAIRFLVRHSAFIHRWAWRLTLLGILSPFMADWVAIGFLIVAVSMFVIWIAAQVAVRSSI